jgi:hypothetical protein
MPSSDEVVQHGHTLRLIEMMRGGIVFDAVLAGRLAELLFEAHHGGAQLEQQRPLIVTDKGDHWRVEGSWNRDRKIEGIGAFYCLLRKFDGCVLDLGATYVVHPHPEDEPFVQEYWRKALDENR